MKTKKAKAPKAKAAAETLHIAPGFGCEAAIRDEGLLEINQRGGDDGDIVDTVVLSKGEFRALIQKFGGWAAA